jgi:hypothetical protein
MSDDLDPRWEWVEIRRFGDPESTYVKGQCNHLHVIHVVAGDEVVAHLCLTCDAQLPAEWRAAP